MAMRTPRAANRMLRLGGAAALVLGVLAVGPDPAAAHSCAEPVTIAQGAETDVEVGVTVGDVPTDLVGFEFPAGFEITGAEGARGWDSAVEGTIVQFSGGTLEAQSCALFEVTVRAPNAGTYRVRALQKVGEGQYVEHPPNGDVFRDADGTQVVVDRQGPPNELFEQIIVVTGGDDGSSTTRTALLIVTAGAVVGACLALLSFRRRRGEVRESA